MARKLPDDPVKRRLQVFKRLFQHIEHWKSLIEAGEMENFIVTPEGEEIFIYDLMIGIDTLPPRQREAFDLICLQSYTESAATAIMLPDSKWSTPIQQYADAALLRMVQAYDAKQAGTWNPNAIKKRRHKSKGANHDGAVPSSPAQDQRSSGEPVECLSDCGLLGGEEAAQSTQANERADAYSGAREEDCTAS